MYKIFYYLSICLIVSAPALAQNSYVRKKVEPSFFIPGKELKQNRKESLPPFPILEEEVAPISTEEDINYEIPAPEVSQAEVQEIVEQKAPKKLPVLDGNKPSAENAQPSSDFENTEKYKEIKSQYQEDLQKTVKDKKIPHNPNIDSILEKMVDGQMIFVDDEFGK